MKITLEPIIGMNILQSTALNRYENLTNVSYKH